LAPERPFLPQFKKAAKESQGRDERVRLLEVRVGLAGEYRITYWEDHRDTVNVRSWGKHRLEGR